MLGALAVLQRHVQQLHGTGGARRAGVHAQEQPRRVESRHGAARAQAQRRFICRHRLAVLAQLREAVGWSVEARLQIAGCTRRQARQGHARRARAGIASSHPQRNTHQQQHHACMHACTHVVQAQRHVELGPEVGGVLRGGLAVGIQRGGPVADLATGLGPSKGPSTGVPLDGRAGAQVQGRAGLLEGQRRREVLQGAELRLAGPAAGGGPPPPRLAGQRQLLKHRRGRGLGRTGRYQQHGDVERGAPRSRPAPLAARGRALGGSGRGRVGGLLAARLGPMPLPLQQRRLQLAQQALRRGVRALGGDLPGAAARPGSCLLCATCAGRPSGNQVNASAPGKDFQFLKPRSPCPHAPAQAHNPDSAHQPP